METGKRSKGRPRWKTRFGSSSSKVASGTGSSSSERREMTSGLSVHAERQKEDMSDMSSVSGAIASISQNGESSVSAEERC